ncbi:hypothetical protein L0Y65_06565 [Candidatus Micrarchaeota archaeon]|nr:hypothetical protein [Candidatus Micrarchaeota archaeon]
METGQISLRLETDAFLYPPIEPFASPARDPAELMRSLLIRCEAFSGRTTSACDSLQSWLAGLVRRNDIAFYGAALTDLSHAKDIDIIVFPSDSPPLLFRKPEFIHLYAAPGMHAMGHASLFVAGPLLFPDLPEISLLRRIEAERKDFESRPFFSGGLGELVTYSAYKAAASGVAAQSGAFPKDFRFRLQRTWLDTANMQTVVHAPHELNEQIRLQMKELKDPEVHALAMAAMRRLRVKESARCALASRFVSELRARC